MLCRNILYILKFKTYNIVFNEDTFQIIDGFLVNEQSCEYYQHFIYLFNIHLLKCITCLSCLCTTLNMENTCIVLIWQKNILKIIWYTKIIIVIVDISYTYIYILYIHILYIIIIFQTWCIDDKQSTSI